MMKAGTGRLTLISVCRRLGTILVAALCVGCSTYTIGVNGFTDAEDVDAFQSGASISVVADPDASNPIFEREVGAKIAALLSLESYPIAADKPDYYLYFGYGIDSGRTVTDFEPVYRPGASAVIGPFGGRSRGYSAIHAPGHITYVPYSQTVYTSWLVLRLVPRASGRKGDDAEPAWIGEISTTGPDSDLRTMVDYMLLAAIEHLGQNTVRRIDKKISRNDPRLAALRPN